MTTVIEFTIPTDAFELGETLAMSAVEIQLSQVVPRGDRFVPYLWARTTDTPDQFAEFEAMLDDDFRVDHLEALEDNGGERLYRIEWATELNGLFAGLRSHELSIEYRRGTADQWKFRAFNREHGRLESFQEYCAAHDIDIQIERVYHPTSLDNRPEWGLTAEQRTVLQTACELGYFDVPQGASLAEVGEELDISRQAASDRLHRGLQTLISEALLVDDS
ncbi:MAG: helix-turn-helix domain-containing protein [Haloplanus sp.]